MKFKVFKVAVASVAFCLSSIAFATPIVYTTSTDSDSDFFAYDTATGIWSQKASIVSRTQLAVDFYGDVHALTTSGEIQKYDAIADTWQTVVSGANGNITGNLEVLNDGRYLISQYSSSSYQLYDGNWTTAQWGFSASQLGDFDPFSNTLVIGESSSQAVHLVDLNDFSTTAYTNGASGQSERRRAGALLDNTFYQKQSTSDLFAIDLSDIGNTFTSVGDGPGDIWFPSAAADRENGLVYVGAIGNGNYGFDVYNVANNTWAGLATIPTGLGYHSTMIVGNVTGSVDVPEPSTLAIFALGMIGLVSRRFNKQS